MPTYNSLGISAALLVTDLDQTLSDEINLRMGEDLQKDTKRIQDHLLRGRALREQPTDFKVGIIQFMGDGEDMVLLVVEAGDGQGGDDGTVKNSDVAQGERRENTNVVPTSTNDTTPPQPTPTQIASGRKRSKRVANQQLKRSEQLTEPSTTPFDQIAAPAAPSSQSRKRSQSHHNNPTNPTDELALCLKVDFTKFYEKAKAEAPLLSGKDLKLEVFINGQLVEVACESASRPWRRSDIINYSGTRFHRQAEKPWVYVPTAAITSGGVDSSPEQRWGNISESLAQEANMRGTNIQGQRPISAQFLAALARSKLPKGVKNKSQHFAVVDLVITAGKGRKYAPDTTYLTEPTRLADENFSGLATTTDSFATTTDGFATTTDGFAMTTGGFATTTGGFATTTDGLAPSRDQVGNFALQGDSQMLGGDFMNLTNSQPSGFTGDMFGMPSEQLNIPATPRTPKTMNMKTSERLRGILNATPMKMRLSKYENAKGHVKGARTLRQRFGDMSKMSPRKQLEVLDTMKDEIDEDTMKAIMEVFELDGATPATSAQKNVHFSLGEDVIAPVPTFPALTFNETFDTKTLVAPAGTFGVTFPQVDLSSFEGYHFGPYPDFQPTFASDANTDVAHSEPTINPANLAPPKRSYMRTPASALSSSPTFVPVKYHHSHHKYQSSLEQMNPFVDDQPMFGLPALHTNSPVTQQQASASSTTQSQKAIAKMQKPERVVTKFQVPELFKRSTVSYAGGLTHRQAAKARGGEFEEQQFVVGVRFIVL